MKERRRSVESRGPLPTARSILGNADVVLICKACDRSVDADLPVIIAGGHGDLPLIELKWRCAMCQSTKVTMVVSGARIGRKDA